MDELNKMQFGEEMKKRTKLFALRVIQVVRALPRNDEGRIIARQLLRAGTAVGSNYRAVCRSRSAKEFIARIGVVIEEADESVFWFEVIVESHILPLQRLKSLTVEGEDLLHIFAKSQSTARINLAKTKKNPKRSP